MRIAIEILMAFTGSTCFAMLFNVRKDKLFWAGLGGGLAWAFYLLLGCWIESDVARFVMSSAALTFYAEIMARIKKTPATFFVVSAAIPLFPGSKLYFTMEAAMHRDWKGFADYGIQTLLLAVAIACGILCTMTMVHAWKKRKKVI
jgi:uncharacterized membrane protein YjjB (DUF3815 family)